jgi:hypothetical protein
MPIAGTWLATLGYEGEGSLHLWDWAAGGLLATVSIPATVCSLSFSDDSRSIITVGTKHLNVWTVNPGEAGAPAVLEVRRDDTEPARPTLFVE